MWLMCDLSHFKFETKRPSSHLIKVKTKNAMRKSVANQQIKQAKTVFAQGQGFSFRRENEPTKPMVIANETPSMDAMMPARRPLQ
jgi:hypothetical protein